MKKFVLLVVLLAPLFMACSDDNATSDPEGFLTLNMLNEDNGKTILNDSGVYINKSNNFVSGGYDRCTMLDVGRVNNLGGIYISSFDNGASEVAVQSQHGYVIVRTAALQSFHSGSTAISIDPNVNLIKLQVLSAITAEDKEVGSAVKYAIVRPETYGLPEYGSTVINVYVYSEGLAENGVAISLPTSDFEYYLVDEDNRVECTQRGSQLVFKTTPSSYSVGTYTLYLRIRESYTKVYVTFKESN